MPTPEEARSQSTQALARTSSGAVTEKSNEFRNAPCPACIGEAIRVRGHGDSNSAEQSSHTIRKEPVISVIFSPDLQLNTLATGLETDLSHRIGRKFYEVTTILPLGI
jgi:hypothetical protein